MRQQALFLLVQKLIFSDSPMCRPVTLEVFERTSLRRMTVCVLFVQSQNITPGLKSGNLKVGL